MTLSVFAEGETVIVGGLTYTSYDTYCILTGCDETSAGEDIVIPTYVEFNGKNCL